MSTKIISLVSIGAHPTSGRPRRAEQDARAVELGLQLAGDNLQVLHAGDVAEPALRAYLGMGLEQLLVLEQPANTMKLAIRIASFCIDLLVCRRGLIHQSYPVLACTLPISAAC